MEVASTLAIIAWSQWRSPDHQKYIQLFLYYYVLTLFDQINESESN